MQVRVRLPTPLRELAAGASSVVVEVAPDADVACVLDALATSYPAIERRVRDELGRPRVHVNVFVGADNIRDLDGVATPVKADQELSILPAISGG